MTIITRSAEFGPIQTYTPLHAYGIISPVVYIDDMRADFGRMIMCHMTADTLAELHTMAQKLGMKRSWFQNKPGSLPHYDISLSKRALAIKYGAKEITQRQMVDILIRHRKNPIK